MTYPEPTPATKPDWSLIGMGVASLIAGTLIGLAIQRSSSEVHELAPPPPAPYVIHERPVSKLETVIGLADIAADLYRDAEEANEEVANIHRQAARTIQRLLMENHRLRQQAKPITPVKDPPDDASTDGLGGNPDTTPGP